MENIPPEAVNGAFGSSADTLPTFNSTFSVNEDAKEQSRVGKMFSPGTNRVAPLQGKKIFMHYEPGTSINKRVEGILKRLKAELVDFFSRDVNYVITNRALNRSSGSPAQIPSLSTSSPSETSPNGALPKPRSTVNSSLGMKGLKTPKLPGSRPPTPTVTRGRAMLMAARKSTPILGTVSHADSPSDILPSSILRQMRPDNMSHAPSEPRMNSHTPAPRLSLNATMLNQSAGINNYPTDLLVRARQLGIKILTIDMVVKWITNLPSDVQSYIESAHRTDSDEVADIPEDPERDRICQVRQLKAPCIKVVDLKGRFRPLYLDHTDYLPGLWSLHAHLRLKSLVTSDSAEVTPQTTGTTGNNTPVCSGSVPAASLGCGPPRHGASQLAPPQCGPGTTMPSVLSRQNSRNKRKDRLIKRSGKSGHPLQRSASVSGKLCDASRSKAVAEDEPSGYCECCTVNFNNLLQHLTCEDHQQFANNGENYRLLDDVLNKLPSIQSFLAKERDALKRQSDKTSDHHQNKTHRSRQTSGSKTSNAIAATTTSKRQQPSTSNQLLDIPNEERPPFCESPAPVLAEKLPAIVCPPPLNLPSVAAVEEKLSGAGQKQLFSDEDSNDICGPLAVDSTVEDALRTVVDGVAADPLETPFCNDSIQVEPVPFSTAEVPVDVDESPKPLDMVQDVPPFCPVHSPGTPTTVRPLVLESSKDPVDPHLLETWHAVCSSVYLSEQFAQHSAESVKPTPNSPGVSPVLEQFHRVCQVCMRSHIPCTIPTQLHLQLHSLVGPRHMVDDFGCMGYGPSFVFSEHTSSTGSPCSVHENEPELDVVPAIDPDNVRASPSFPIPVVIEQSMTSPHSPVFDCIDDCTDAEATESTLPFVIPETPSSPPSPIDVLSHRKQCELSSVPCTRSPPVLNLSTSISMSSKSGFLSRVADKPQNISTPITSPSLHQPLLCDTSSDRAATDSSLSPASSTRSDLTNHRRSSVWKLNSTSFECTLPSDSKESTHHHNDEKRYRHTQLRKHKSTKRSKRKRQQSHSLLETKTLSDLPVVKRPKVSTQSLLPRSKYPSAFLSKTTVDQTSNKRPVRSSYKTKAQHELSTMVMTPDRSTAPRLAAKVAREAISLSVRALFSPSDMDRCFEARHPVIYAARLSPADTLPTTPRRRRVKSSMHTPSHSCGIDLTSSPRGEGTFRSRPHNRTLFPERIAS